PLWSFSHNFSFEPPCGSVNVCVHTFQHMPAPRSRTRAFQQAKSATCMPGLGAATKPLSVPPHCCGGTAVGPPLRTTVQQIRDLLQELCREVLADGTHSSKRLGVWWCAIVFCGKRLPILETVPTCQRREL